MWGICVFYWWLLSSISEVVPPESTPVSGPPWSHTLYLDHPEATLYMDHPEATLYMDHPEATLYLDHPVYGPPWSHPVSGPPCIWTTLKPPCIWTTLKPLSIWTTLKPSCIWTTLKPPHSPIAELSLPLEVTDWLTEYKTGLCRRNTTYAGHWHGCVRPFLKANLTLAGALPTGCLRLKDSTKTPPHQSNHKRLRHRDAWGKVRGAIIGPTSPTPTWADHVYVRSIRC